MTGDLAAIPKTVYFIDSNDVLQIVGACKVCRVTQEDIDRNLVVVSRNGIAHYANDYGDTDCGKDATKTGWWWPC